MQRHAGRSGFCVTCWVIFIYSSPSEITSGFSALYSYQSDNLGRGTVTQESEHVPSLWNYFPSFRGGLHVAWCCVGFKASEAFHSVSFPPWNPWISHITSYCPCQAVAHLATARLCPWLLLRPYGFCHGQHMSTTVKHSIFFPFSFPLTI